MNRTVEAKIVFSISVSHRCSKWTMCIILVSIASNFIIQYKLEICNKMFSFETSFPRKSSLTTCQFTRSWLIPDWIRADKIGSWLFHIHEKINLKCGMQFFHLKSRFLGNEIWKFIEHTSYRAKHVETRFLKERNFKWKNYIPHVLNVWIISLFKFQNFSWIFDFSYKLYVANWTAEVFSTKLPYEV